MHLGVVLAVGNRQHRNVGLGVFLFAVNGQGPEMRRGPGEDDQHQQQRLGADMPGDSNPPQQRRRGAREATDDNVLRGRTLEKAGVDHRIAEQRGQREPGRQRVGERQ
jgi:hypothetical protein